MPAAGQSSMGIFPCLTTSLMRINFIFPRSRAAGIHKLWLPTHCLPNCNQNLLFCVQKYSECLSKRGCLLVLRWLKIRCWKIDTYTRDVIIGANPLLQQSITNFPSKYWRTFPLELGNFRHNLCSSYARFRSADGSGSNRARFVVSKTKTVTKEGKKCCLIEFPHWGGI